MRSLRELRNEEGIALVMALGVMFVLTIAAVAVIQFTTSNSRSASYNRSNNQAEGYAEAGVNFARSVLWQAADPGAMANFSNTAVVEGQTVQYSGTYDAGTRVWTLTGVSTVINPTAGTKQITRTVTTQVQVESSFTWDPNTLKVWERLYANSANDCAIELKNNNVVGRAVYSRGGLCLKNNDAISAGDVQVHKGLEMGNGTKITTDKLQVGSGCGKDAQGKPIKCSNGGGITAKESDVVPEGLTKPPLDLSGWYASASPGPAKPCTVGSVPGGFDNDGVSNKSRPVFALTSNPSFTCTNADGTFTWNTTTDILLISGTVFFDGDISFGGNLRVTGEGTLYAAGSITLGSGVSLCSTLTCDGTGWSTGGNRLALVAGQDFTMENKGVLEAAVFAGGNFEAKNGGTIIGPVVAENIYLKNNATILAAKFGMPLAGMPGGKITTNTLKNVSGSTRIS